MINQDSNASKINPSDITSGDVLAIPFQKNSFNIQKVESVNSEPLTSGSSFSIAGAEQQHECTFFERMSCCMSFRRPKSTFLNNTHTNSAQLSRKRCSKIKSALDDEHIKGLSLFEIKNDTLRDYLISKEKNGALPSNKIIKRLIELNETVEEVRESFRNIRANCIATIPQRENAIHHYNNVLLLRDLKNRSMDGTLEKGKYKHKCGIYSPKYPALALLFKDGFCGEYADVTHFMVSKNIHPNETVYITESPDDKFAHAWVQLEIKEEDKLHTIVIDSYFNSPPILFEDSIYHRFDKLKRFDPIVHEDAKQWVYQVEETKARISNGTCKIDGKTISEFIKSQKKRFNFHKTEEKCDFITMEGFNLLKPL